MNKIHAHILVKTCIRSLFSRLFAEIYEFCRSAFLGLLLAGLAIIALLRFLLRFIKDSTARGSTSCRFWSGLFLLLCISRVTFIIFLVVRSVPTRLAWVLKHEKANNADISTS